MTYKEKLAELAAAEPKRFVDWMMETGRKVEAFKTHISTGTIEPISKKDFRVPFICHPTSKS